MQALNPYCRSPLAGKPFSEVFVHEPIEDETMRWRLRGSGVNGLPEDALVTCEVLRLCWELRLSITEMDLGSPVNADSAERDCSLLGLANVSVEQLDQELRATVR